MTGLCYLWNGVMIVACVLLCSGVCYVASHCVVLLAVEWRWGVWSCSVLFCSVLFCLVFLLLFVLLVFGVVRAQLCEHARYPRTPLRPLVVCVVFFSLPRLSSVIGMAVCVYHVLVCLVGMTATGSLSLSPSFF